MTLRLWMASAAGVAILLGGASLYWKGRMAGAAAERPRTALALDRAATAELGMQGAHEGAARVEIVVRRRDAAAATLAHITPDIFKSEAAHAPLDADRRARLRGHDRELCQLADDGLSGCSASPGDAGRSDQDLLPLRPAGPTE